MNISFIFEKSVNFTKRKLKMTGFLVKKVTVQCMVGMVVVVVYEGRCPGHPYAGAPPLSRMNWLFL